MSKLANLLVALTVAASLTACTQEGDDTGPTTDSAIGVALVFDAADRPAYEAYRLELEAHTTPDPQAALSAPEAIDELFLGAADSAVCECADAECATAWIEENLGCGVCVLAICDGGNRGGGCAAPCSDEL